MRRWVLRNLLVAICAGYIPLHSFQYVVKDPRSLAQFWGRMVRQPIVVVRPFFRGRRHCGLFVSPSTPSFETPTGDKIAVIASQFNNTNPRENWSEVTIVKSTYDLLNMTTVGVWEEHHFLEAAAVIEAWSHRQSKRAAVSVERLLGRIVLEQKAKNPRADCVDLTALYTNLLEGWAKCDDRGTAERAEEILDYFQKVFEDGDSYDPLLCGPDLRCFNAIIAAYARRGTPDAPQQAVRVLSKLIEWNREGKTSVIPNTTTYAYVLRAYANQRTSTAPELVRRLLSHMELLSETYPLVKPDYTCHNVYLYALTKAVNENRIDTVKGCKLAEEYLEMLIRSNDDEVRPDKWSFNMVLALMSKSGTWDMVERAESLVRELETYHNQSGASEKSQPNANTYNALMSCIARSTDPKKIAKASALLAQMKDIGEINPSAKPDSISYSIIMNLHATSRQHDAPIKVEELLYEMREVYNRTGDWFIKPNRRSINACLDAWAKSGSEEAADRIMEWIKNMDVTPDTWSYNHYLQALSRSTKKHRIGDEAVRVLDEIEARYYAGHLCLKPNVITFTSALHCIAMSRQDDAVEVALAVLDRMENFNSNSQREDSIRPNIFTYNCIINTIAKSKRPGKAFLAAQFLDRMTEVSLRPGIVSYNNVLNSCAFSSDKADKPEQILELAMMILAKAQERPGANWITYQTVIRVLCTFENDPDKRWLLTQELVRQCCKDGQLTHSVLSQARFACMDERFELLRQEVCYPNTNRMIDKYTVNARKSIENNGHQHRKNFFA